MNRFVTNLTLAMAILVLTAGAMASVPAGASANDKDCSDFATQRAAQFFFLRHGGPRHDPHRLDADHDGIACEDNPCPCYYKKRLPRAAWIDSELADLSALLVGS
jgi:hypothetical protein